MDETNASMNVSNEKIRLIEIKIKKTNQLFNSLDPSPFLDKDLDDDAADYIYSSVAEHHLGLKQKIIIHMPKSQQKKISEVEIRRAIQHYFDYKKTLCEKNIRLKIREGQFSFIVGLSFLAFCLIVSNWILRHYDSLFSNILVEGLFIGGWVAMWKPISNILYDWWPLRKEKKICDKISTMHVEVKHY